MALSIGIVGLPNVGKSTLFNALTKAQNAQAANYPFCTIEPNKATVQVPDSRVEALAAKVSPQKIIHANVDFIDIAGLVKGASKGEGLGNQFLGNIRECAAIIQVVRCFDDDNITHVEAKIDPLRDIETIQTELLLADIQTLEKRLEKTLKMAKGNKDAKQIAEVWQTLLAHLNAGHLAADFELPASTDALEQAWKEMGLLTAKPTIYCANVDEQGLSQANDYAIKVQDYAKAHNSGFCLVCAKLEEELQGLSEEEQHEMLTSYGLAASGLEKIIQVGYANLGLCSYFTAGPDEVRAWTIHKGWKAPKAAGVIHTDFERGFIRAEVISYTDFMQHKNEAECRAAAVLRTEGKDYVVQDGDIMHFLFNV
ncbi:MAG: redox-regulated ATPase YchF [Desulfovibrionaceae bacterium]|nr:redox-regulated ATPase YchF [Desulfovibrionaceae bacterium]